ncbi:hypothetical protein HanXRQr2_Chr12g0561401 [Helianthus annuus]|uniref:Uncharacterized protein n=1 Tax=Helianthus annuus TaxID=4232 RepID=A0A9K3HJN5_HELAN|nr:hypothetical protein HanXRQr2_Chr12g0561401 [Helianthus annuus]KAJ0864343.1 hypothetical protein HanPSC8_Chr12g0540831 [Helianthus annuus]
MEAAKIVAQIEESLAGGKGYYPEDRFSRGNQEAVTTGRATEKMREKRLTESVTRRRSETTIVTNTGLRSQKLQRRY